MWLKKNTYRCSGIEYPGCCNTGYAPTAKHAAGYGYDFYLVGYQLDVMDMNITAAALVAADNGQRIVKDTLTGKRAYVYTSTQPARRKYEAMCQAATDDRNAEIARINALRQKRRAGDMGAILELGLDYGM